jgi:hypothetical protein
MCDPAESIGSEDRLQSERWTKFEEDDPTSIRVIISPGFHFTDYHLAQAKGIHPQKALDNDIAEVAQIYQDAFQGIRSTLNSNDAQVEREPYTPPSAWRKGGELSAPWQIVQLVFTSEVGIGVVSGLAAQSISAAAIKAWRAMLKRWKTSEVEPQVRNVPSHSPLIMTALCERHARQYHGDKKVFREGNWFRVAWSGADAPASLSLLLVTIPIRSGSLVYVVTDRLELMQLIETSPRLTAELDRRTWALMLESDPID